MGKPNGHGVGAVLGSHAALGTAPVYTPEEMTVEVEKMQAQLSRYGFRIEAMPAQNVVKFTLTHTQLVDIAPPVFYLPVPLLLKTVGQVLSQLDVG